MKKYHIPVVNDSENFIEAIGVSKERLKYLTNIVATTLAHSVGQDGAYTNIGYRVIPAAQNNIELFSLGIMLGTQRSEWQNINMMVGLIGGAAKIKKDVPEITLDPNPMWDCIVYKESSVGHPGEFNIEEGRSKEMNDELARVFGAYGGKKDVDMAKVLSEVSDLAQSPTELFILGMLSGVIIDETFKDMPQFDPSLN